MMIFILFLLEIIQCGIIAEYEEYDEYYYSCSGEEDIFQQGPASHDMSTPSPPLFQGSGLNDINIENIPICWEDSDNEDCGQVFINVADLENREKIFLADIGYLYLDYATEENGIHSLVYSGEGDVTAYFTYSGSSVIGTINRQDGKIVKIMSLSDNKQAMSLIDAPHSSKTEDDEEVYVDDPVADSKDITLNSEEEEMLLHGETDPSSMVQVTVKVYFNENAKKQMMGVKPEVFIRGLINEVNDGYRRSRVPIKIILYAHEETDSEKVNDKDLGKACSEAYEECKNLVYCSDYLDEDQISQKCQKMILAQFRKMKGKEGGSRRQSKKVRDGANIAVLLVHEIPGHSNFCGRASKVYDIGRKKMNLAVVSIAGACEYTFGHEIGHLLGLSHQKVGKDQNRYFSYGHGYGIAPKKNEKAGTRTVMAKSSALFKKRLNVYSSPLIGTGTPQTEDNARVLRETRFLAAYTENSSKDDLQYSVQFKTQKCGESSVCVPVASCSDIMKPKTFLDKLCGYEKVCCETDPGCVQEFPEIEHKKDGWFMFGNRQHSLTLAVGNSRGDGSYYATVSDIMEGDDRQVWKWDGDWLASKWNTEYVLDGSSSPYIIAKRTESKYQKWRFSDGFLVNLGVCKETTVVDDMAIARKWFRVDVDKKGQTNTHPLPTLKFSTFLCGEDEICMDIDHCYEAVPSVSITNKFCDKNKICCKNKICHDVEEFESTEAPVKGWFVIESELNQKYLTVKEGNASSGQPVVNSSPKKNNQNQLWMWKDDNLVSKLDETFVLDGSFGIVSIQKKKHGNVFQKWRKSGGFLVNAGHCEVIDVAYGNKEDDALVTIWSIHGQSHQKWITRCLAH